MPDEPTATPQDELSGPAPGTGSSPEPETSAGAPPEPAPEPAELEMLAAELIGPADSGSAADADRGPTLLNASVGATLDEVAVFTPPDLAASTPAAQATIELLDDVELDVKIELGRANMYVEDVLKLGPGSVVELDKLAGDPVDIYVNDRLVARGEVLVLNENFCVRINDIKSPVPELDHG
jgi:flagellar motor switch protein FliN/FliY